jgi:formylglycine-generating enzyme required for sulfatase activity
LAAAIGVWQIATRPTPPPPDTAAQPAAPPGQAPAAGTSPADVGARSAEREGAMRLPESFHDCARGCPEMIVIPAGEFTMGPSPAEKERFGDKNEPHQVKIATPFAVSKFAITFADWGACVAGGGCPEIGDAGFGRGTRPMINVTWNDAQLYVAWLARMTGQPYRLLTEAEWEYAARAGTTTAYVWGDEIGQGNANCNGCGTAFDNRRTAPVGSFKPNAFGLYDMAGNVWQWVQDCHHGDYQGAPPDGSAWTSGDCNRRVARGGSWVDRPEFTRSADRLSFPARFRIINLGFRVGRTLTP